MEKYIIDQKTYILAKDKNNNDVTNKQIQDIVFKILLELDRICRKNNIPYALAFGSALGLYNYGDFIPWDDDADVLVPYEYYLPLVECLKRELGEDFTFECYEVDNRANTLIPPLKIRYKHSYIKEKNHFTLPNRTKRGNGIFIDVGVLMGVPERKIHQKIINKSKRIMPLYVFLDAFLHINPLWLKKRLKRREKETYEKYKDSGLVSQSVVLPFQEYPHKMVKNLSFPKEVIYPFQEYDFRGHKLYSFHKLEDFCRLRYGEESLKKYVDGHYIEPYKHKKSDHLLRADIEK